MSKCRSRVTAFAVCAAALLRATSEAAATNLTLYRITPRNYTGLSNLDTGDSAGDAFFGLYEMVEPLLCNVKGLSSGMYGLLCRNNPLLQIPGFNVYTRSVVEVDDRFGHYAQCNPSKTPPHEFVCEHFDHDCWYKNPDWAKQFADFCDMKDCYCPTVETLAVGLEHPDFASHPQKDMPVQCQANYENFNGYKNANRATQFYHAENITHGDCCSLCDSFNTEEEVNCSSYSFVKESFSKMGTCSLHTATSSDDFTLSPLATSGFSRGVGRVSFVSRAAGELSELMHGAWYSTQGPSRCNSSTEVIGKDCWWREIAQTSQVNATCVNGHVVDKVRARRPDCWQQCPQPQNQSSACFIECLFETLVGNASAVPPVPATPRDVIKSAFEMAFDEGACPQIPDCPEPCLPPCWGVPAGDPCTNDDTAYRV